MWLKCLSVAGAGLVTGLPLRTGADGGQRDRADVVLQETGLAEIAVSLAAIEDRLFIKFYWLPAFVQYT